MFRQLQGVSFKRMGVSKPGIGKTQRNLSHAVALQTTNPLNLQLQKDDLKSHGKRPESSRSLAPQGDIPASTNRTVKSFSPMTNREDDRFPLISRLNITVANNAESVIQNTRGHAPPP